MIDGGPRNIRRDRASLKLPAVITRSTVGEQEADMSVFEAKELADLRQTLRDRLIAQDAGGATDVLTRLREVASGDDELSAEYERWAFRFELLAA